MTSHLSIAAVIALALSSAPSRRPGRADPVLRTDQVRFVYDEPLDAKHLPGSAPPCRSGAFSKR